MLIFVNLQCLYFFPSIQFQLFEFLTSLQCPTEFFSSLYQIRSLFIHTIIVYEEVATVAELLIASFAFPSTMSISSCLSHSPLTFKVHFLSDFLLLLLLFNFTCNFSFTFLVIPYLLFISYFFWVSAHSPLTL